MTNLCFRTFSNLFLSRGRGKRASLKASNLTGMSIHGMFEYQLPEFFKKRLHVEVNEDDQQAQKIKITSLYAVLQENTLMNL